ncbi:hypothetical protein SDJN03_28876, partial [Cucurbita argyrosperma subsp. sororia]
MVSTGRRRRRRRRRISLPRTRSSSKGAVEDVGGGVWAAGRWAIKLPCEAAFVEYIVYLIRRHVDFEVEKALVLSIAPAVKGCCGSNLFSSAARVAEAGRPVMMGFEISMDHTQFY